jgi:hypothetical protein
MAKPPSFIIERSSMLNFINFFGSILRKAGINPVQINADPIIAKAKKKANFNGELPQAEKGLRILIESINKEGRPNTFGAIAIKALLERILYGRYKVEQELARNPLIEKSAVNQPVFIIGMPRTGTTILHALMSEDSAHRSPLAWECLLPYPVSTPDTFRNNDQIKRVEKEFAQLFKLVPDFEQKHHMAADSPQECIGITALDFNSFLFSAQLYLGEYMNWFLNHSDMLGTMKFHKRFLQYLQSGGVKSERWLLKTPVHLMRLSELFEVYPDARIIMTHRSPEEIVASTASLISSVRSLYSDKEDPIRTGHEQADIWSSYFKKFLSSRKLLNKEDQIIDLQFDDFVKDQIGTVRKIYKKFNWPLSDETVSKFERFLQEHPQHKKGKHIYSLEAFGMDKKAIRDQYSDYITFLKELKSKQNDT